MATRRPCQGAVVHWSIPCAVEMSTLSVAAVHCSLETVLISKARRYSATQYNHMLLCLHCVQVLSLALPAAGVAVGVNGQLRTWLLPAGAPAAVAQPPQPPALPDAAAVLSVTPSEAAAGLVAAAQGASPAGASIHAMALLHLSQEAVLALLLPAACRIVLGSRVTAASASSYWAVQTLATCLLLFPLVDPLLSSVWRPVAEVRQRAKVASYSPVTSHTYHSHSPAHAQTLSYSRQS